MQTTWFKVSKGSVRIEPVSVERYTDSCVYIRGRQLRRYTSHDCYFKTWEEARQRLVERHRLIVQTAEAQLRVAQNNLRDALAQTPTPRIEFGASLTRVGCGEWP